MNTATDTAAVAENTFQSYTARKQSFKTITPKGRVIVIVDYKFVTKNQEEIDYLDYEIENGFSLLSKGVTVTSEDADPMSALRKRIIAEHEAEKAAEAEVRDLGTTAEGGKGAAKLNPVASAALKKLAAGSSSADAAPSA